MANANIPPKGKKSLEAEITLVPFIDFLSICICFLLMTAVWIQISNLEVKQKFGTAGEATKVVPLELEISFLKKEKVQILLKKNSKTVKTFAVDIVDENYRVNVSAMVKKIMDTNSGVKQASITTSSQINHQIFIEILDGIRGLGITELGVNHGV